MKKYCYLFLIVGLALSLVSCSSSYLSSKKYEKAAKRKDVGLCPNCNTLVTLSDYLSVEDRMVCPYCMKKTKVGIMKSYYLDYITSLKETKDNQEKSQ